MESSYRYTDEEWLEKQRIKCDNYNSNWEEPKGAGCELCRNKGWIMYCDEKGNTISKDCVCRERERVEAALRASGMADALRRNTFDSFETGHPGPRP